MTPQGRSTLYDESVDMQFISIRVRMHKIYPVEDFKNGFKFVGFKDSGHRIRDRRPPLYFIWQMEKLSCWVWTDPESLKNGHWKEWKKILWWIYTMVKIRICANIIGMTNRGYGFEEKNIPSNFVLDDFRQFITVFKIWIFQVSELLNGWKSKGDDFSTFSEAYQYWCQIVDLIE